MRALGIDIGGSAAKLAVIDADGVRTARSVGYDRPDREELKQAIRGAIDQLGVPIDASVPVGLCVPGRRSAEGDQIERSLNLACIEGWAFDAMLREVLGHTPERMAVVSDIHAATVDLVRAKQSRGRVVVVAIGTGVGLGVWEDGQMLSIGGRSIGHLGQIDVGRLENVDRIGADGARNTLESFVGLPALRARWGGLDGERLSRRIDSMRSDDPAATALVRALRIVHAIYVPDTVVLAGGVGLALAPLGGVLQQRVNDGLTSLARPEWSLCFGDSLYHASLGAARLALG